jgi:hypothetical protein
MKTKMMSIMMMSITMMKITRTKMKRMRLSQFIRLHLRSTVEEYLHLVLMKSPRKNKVSSSKCNTIINMNRLTQLQHINQRLANIRINQNSQNSL